MPLSDSLYVVDEAGWLALDLASSGAGGDAIHRELAGRYGGSVAGRCVTELDALRRLEAGAGGPPAGLEDWLPSSAEAPLLRALCLNVAHDCDLSCRYCFAGRGEFGGERALMSPGVARAAVDFLLRHSGGVPSLDVDFFGGEPLLNLGVVRATVDYARRRAGEAGRTVRFTLTTNAFSLGEEEAAYLDRTMENVVLSLDGRPAVHDRMRRTRGGRATHARVLGNIKSFVARREDRDYWVRGTYTAHNPDFAEDALYMAAEGFRNISLEPVVGGGDGGEGPPDWAIGEKLVPELAGEYMRLADALHGAADGGRKVTFFHFMADSGAAPCYAKRVRGCGAGREYMAVTPEGDLYPCHQFVGRPGYRLGSVLTGLAPRRPGSDVGGLRLGSKSACAGCWARYRCSGGCHANALAATGSLLEPDPLACLLMKARLEAALYLEALSASPDTAPAGGRTAGLKARS